MRRPRQLVSKLGLVPPMILAVLTALLALPCAAGAYATLEGPPTFSAAPGLPDGRVYEEASPVNDNGNQAGASTLLFSGDPPGRLRYALASADGDSVLFEATGPIGEAVPSASVLFYVATRTSSGWKTRSVLPAPRQSQNLLGGSLFGKPKALYISPDFSHALVEANLYTLAPLPGESSGELCGNQIYLTGPDPFVAATWLERPETANPVVNCNAELETGAPVGGSPDFSTVYFAYPGTLLPEDAPRAPHAQGVPSGEPNARFDVEAWGFYEYAAGVLREAGTLPADSPYPNEPSPWGAVPATSGHGKALSGNEVSADGSRAFFLSPDPASCTYNGGHNNCAVDPPELYVREDGSRTLLVSKDTLLPEAEGLAAAAPDGVRGTPDRAQNFLSYNPPESYVFASPDGSQAFFYSEDRLTPQAPADASVKTYDFDVDTGALTYLPNVAGQILATDGAGSALAFVRPASGGAPAELERWSAGPGGGSVTPVVQLPAGEDVEPVRISSDGSVLVFTAGELPGFNDAGSSQIFRYDAVTNTLGCVSCAPPGVASASASISIEREGEASGDEQAGMLDERGLSADGDRVFFQTQAPLVPQDTNTATTVPALEHEGTELQGEDVYEWENGVVYPLSTGKSSRNSYFLDSSESGDDVFFATTEGLVPGDTDGGYSVYDARVPRPGDNPPPAAVPCEGAVCQGPPHVESPLAPPARATFPGSDNLVTEPAVAPAKKTTTKTVKCKRGYIKKKNKCVKRPKAKKSAKRSK